MLKLLIAVDGSEHAKHAIEAAARLARECGAVEAVLVNVSEGPRYYGELPPLDYESVVRQLREQQEALLGAALTQALACGLGQVVTAGAMGLVAQEIVRIAGERGVDQIVMGTRGMSALGGLLLGSVAQRVVHLAAVPVLLVK